MTTTLSKLLAAMTLTTFTLVASPISPDVVHALPSENIVISQVYGGGGNTGAPFTNDYVELFNRGTTTVSLAGMSVQYASATGTGNFAANPVTTLTGSLAAGQYYLVKQAAPASPQGAALPTADATGTVNMAAAAGKVIVANTTTGLACNGGSTPCAPDQLAQIVDLVGYGGSGSGGANFFEGAPAPALSNTTAGLRKSGGCVDTDNNSTDIAAGTPNPRNTASTLNVCGAVTLSISVNDVAQVEGNSGTSTFTFNVSLSGAAGAGGVTFDIATADGTAQDGDPTGEDSDYVARSLTGQTIAEGSSGPYTFSVTVNGDTTTEPNETFFVNVTNVTGASIADGQGQATIQNDDVTLIPIHTIQGAAHRSPLTGQRITTSGIVTAKIGNGFYIQDPSPDADDATSEAIFVFTSSAPTVSLGDSVVVTANVSEFRPGGNTSTNLTTTELASPSVITASTGNPLPAATVLGALGRTPPTQVIEDDASGDVETSGVFDPASDGIDFYESLEGMLVQVDNPVAVGPTNSFGEIAVLADNGAGAGLRTPRGGIIIQPGDFNPERIILDDVIAPTPIVNTGDHFAGSAVGVMDYSFGNFKLLITQSLNGVSGNLTRESATPATTGQLAVATFNVENLDPADGNAKFETLASLIVANLASPDIIAIEEAQDNTGAVNDGVVDASVTFETLISAIETAGGPTYEFREIDPVNNQDGGEPGGNIRVGFLFRTDRGLSFVDRPGGTSTAAVSVVDGADGPELTFSPGRIDPTNAAFTTSRKPLAGEFEYNGEKLFVIANHFNSKGGDDPLFGHLQPPTLSSEVQRKQQAQIVNDFVDSILALDPAANIIAAGDFNDFQFSDALAILEGGVLHDMIDTLPANERYSYVFDGNSQTLDHILVSSNLLDNASPAHDVVHVNAEFADQASDHDPQVSTFVFDAARPEVTINRAAGQADPTTDSPVNFTVVFSEPVTGFTDGDVALSGTAGATSAVVTGGGTTYNVAVSGMTNDGTVIASVPADSATDAVGHGNNASTTTDNEVQFNFNVAPVATVTNGQCGGAATGTINLTLADADGDALTLTLESNSNTTLVPNSAVVLGGTGTARTLTVTAADKKSGTATLTFRLSDGTVTVLVVVGVVVGTDASETLIGTNATDMMFGLNGNDTVSGEAGNDLLCGGNGSDNLNGGNGSDVLDGQKGNDVLAGGAADDRLRGDAGNDSLTGDAGADAFSGGSGADVNTDFNAVAGDTSDGT
jgi:predicted extracellular nuclease